MVSPPLNPSVIPNLDEAATDLASWLKDRGSYRPCLSENLEQTRVRKLRSIHLTKRPTSSTEVTPDGFRRHQNCDRAESKIQSRISDGDQPTPVESCSAGRTSYRHQVRAEIPIKIRNVETGSSGQRRSASGAGSSAREELRRLLASSDHESSIEERIRSLERENVEMLLEIWRSKLEFARVKRELRSELFRLKMERILDKFKL